MKIYLIIIQGEILWLVGKENEDIKMSEWKSLNAFFRAGAFVP